MIKLTSQISKDKINYLVSDVGIDWVASWRKKKKIPHSLQQIKFLMEERFKCKK